jgi:hypothetical protein
MQKFFELIKLGYVLAISQVKENLIRVAFTRVSLSEGVPNYRLQAEFTPEEFSDENGERWAAVIKACQHHIDNPPPASPHII